MRFGLYYSDIDHTISKTTYLNTWIHLAFTYNSLGHREIFLNGSRVKHDTNGSTFTNPDNNDLHIGRYNYTNTSDLQMDDLRIYKVVVSANEISQIYNDTIGTQPAANGNFHTLQKADITGLSGQTENTLIVSNLTNIDTIENEYFYKKLPEEVINLKSTFNQRNFNNNFCKHNTY